MNQFSDELGKTCYGPDSNVPSKPAGDDFIEKTADEYLVPGAEVTRNVKLVWMLTTRCGRVRLKIVEFDIHTKLGYCSVRPEIMKAIGHCRIPITLLTEKWKRVQPSKVGKYINETSTIAGRKCVIITQELRQMKSRYCVLQTDQFADVSETGRWFPGVVLQEDTHLEGDKKISLVKSEVTTVEADVSIPVSTLLPHLFGNYKIIP